MEGFQFESDFMEDGVRCIPMAVRIRLDMCGIKLRLSEWSKMSDSEKLNVSRWDFSCPEEMSECCGYLKAVVLDRTGNEATMLAIDAHPDWANRSSIPLAVIARLAEFNWSMTTREWSRYSDLQRFALVKLTRPGHENRNFPMAVKEFRQTHTVPVL
jgi:hypothetical protein